MNVPSSLKQIPPLRLASSRWLVGAGLLVALLPICNAHAGATVTIDDQRYLTLDYSLQAWAQARSYTSATDKGNNSDFFLRRNRITLSGQYNDYVGFYAQLEAGNEGKNGDSDKSVYYRDAYVTVDYSDAARFILGHFKNTFSRENLEACLEPLTLDRSQISYTPFGGTRDDGIAIWGNLADAALQYRLMIADGRSGDEVVKKAPRVTARVHWSVLDPEFDYGYRGTYLGTRKILTFGAAYDYQPDVAYANYPARTGSRDYKAWTADAFFEYPFSFGTVTLSGAYLDYGVGNAINHAPDPDLPANTELHASYVKGGYLFPGKIGFGRLQVFARHDVSDYHLDTGYLDNVLNGGGFNYYIDGQQLKVTVEYDNVDYQGPDPTNRSLQDSWQVTVGFQLIL